MLITEDSVPRKVLAKLRSQVRSNSKINETKNQTLVSCDALPLLIPICTGTFVYSKQRPANPLAAIHSKPIVYVNNGGGRDTYISDYSGGLRTMYRPAHGKRTFYNSLREYDQRGYGFGKRNQSHTATMQEKRDDFSKSQNHYNSKYKREMNLVTNYQRMLDHRLSKPKQIAETVKVDGKHKIYKNSAQPEQDAHQESFYRSPAKGHQHPSGAFSPQPERDGCRSFQNNLTSYSNMKPCLDKHELK